MVTWSCNCKIKSRKRHSHNIFFPCFKELSNQWHAYTYYLPPHNISAPWGFVIFRVIVYGGFFWYRNWMLTVNFNNRHNWLRLSRNIRHCSRQKRLPDSCLFWASQPRTRVATHHHLHWHFLSTIKNERIGEAGFRENRNEGLAMITDKS